MINDVSTRFRAGFDGSSRSNRRGFTLVELLVVIGVIVLLIAILLPAARRTLEAGRQVTCLNHLRQLATACLMYCHDNDGAFPGITGVKSGDTAYEAPLSCEWIYAESAWPNAPFNDVARSPIMRYLPPGELTVLRCPSDDIASHAYCAFVYAPYGPYNFSYAMNGWIGQWPRDWDTSVFKTKYRMWPAKNLREIKDPSQKFWFIEEDPRFIDDGTYTIKMFMPNGYAEPPSYVHDVYRDMANPGGPSLGWSSRTNVVFVDGHGEFVTGQFIVDPAHPENHAHYDPHW